MRPSRPRRFRFTPPPLRVQLPITLALTATIDVLCYVRYRRYPYTEAWLVPVALLLTLLVLTAVLTALRFFPSEHSDRSDQPPLPDRPPDLDTMSRTSRTPA